MRGGGGIVGNEGQADRRTFEVSDQGPPSYSAVAVMECERSGVSDSYRAIEPGANAGVADIFARSLKSLAVHRKGNGDRCGKTGAPIFKVADLEQLLTYHDFAPVRMDALSIFQKIGPKFTFSPPVPK